MRVSVELLLLWGDEFRSDDCDFFGVGQVCGWVLAYSVLWSGGWDGLADQQSGEGQVKRKHLFSVGIGSVRGADGNRPSVHLQPPPASKTFLEMKMIK